MGRRKSARPKKRQRITGEDLVRYIRGTPEKAASLRQILADFDIGKEQRREARDFLQDLVKDGRLVKHRGGRFELPRENRFIQGRILLHRDGYGFVIPDQPVPGIDSDIFIPPPQTQSAMSGDSVTVEITIRKRGSRAEGRVLKIEKRARDTVVGQLRFDGQSYFAAPLQKNLPERILIPGDVSEHKDKIVEIEITRFPTPATWPVGRIVSAVGFLDDPEVETTVIMRNYGLDAAFPAEVEAEAAAVPEKITEADLRGRTDFREAVVFTIDPATARDFDDAVGIELLDGAGYSLAVHIADVAHFVPLDSAMDHEARLRATSVYFPDRVIPMLPERVSNDLCSLNPGVDRFAMTVVIEIDRDGSVRKSSFHNSVIHSRERLSYESAQQILDGDPGHRERYAAIATHLQHMERLARILSRRRAARGALDFDLPEPILTYDESGDVSGITRSARLFTHRLIEEFMIVANEVVARALEGRGVPAIYRTHESPDPMKVEEFSRIVDRFGHSFRTRSPKPADFQKFLDAIENRPEARILSYLMLRSFKQAVYSTENGGHFGLASEAYTHFTSPIRRYPDLMVHRILKTIIGKRGAKPFSQALLASIAAESSQREREADQAERELMEWKKALLMEKRIGDRFEALVIGVSPDGLAIELTDQFVEGFIPTVELPGGGYYFDQGRRVLGNRSGRRFSLGDRLRVAVVRVDRFLRRVYFAAETRE